MLIHLKDFAGLAPKISDRSLPVNYASTANNAQLYSGELRGLDEPRVVADLTSEVFTVKRAYRLFDGSTSIADTLGDWIPFDETDVNFLRGALKNDQFDRYYASGGTLDPSVNSAANWAAGATPFDLGVPAPDSPATVVPQATGGAVEETRSYVYTFVNIWGEESAPSPASAPATGDIDATWALSLMDTAFPIAGSFQTIDKIHIYRTVTGQRSVDFRFVAEVDPPASTYNDNESNDTVSLNESLPSNGWDIPPAGLQGIVNMPNGIMAGFIGRDLYFSEPYRPHTFPLAYQVSVDSDIVGLGVYQSGIVVCTTANPYVATGTHPASIALTRIDDVEPCVSFRSIVNGMNGVTFASANGLVVVNQSGAFNITQPLITRNEWRQEYSPFTIQAAADGDKTLAFNSLSTGFLFQPQEPLGHLVTLSGFADVQAVQTDPFTGEAYTVTQDVVALWNPTDTSPLSYVWKSKEFELPYPVNMGAYRVQYKDVITGADYVPGFDYTAYNTDRIATPLDTLNLRPLNAVKVEAGMTDSPPVTQNRSPLGGPVLYPTEPLTIRDQIRVRVYGDGVLRYEREITSNDVMRLPSGYKADKWQVELTTAQNVYSFKLAGTAKELAKA